MKTELLRDIATAGVNYPLLQIAFGNLGHAQSLKTLDLFTREILPAVRKL